MFDYIKTPQTYAMLKHSNYSADLIQWTWIDYWHEGFYQVISSGKPADIDNLVRELNKAAQKETINA